MSSAREGTGVPPAPLISAAQMISQKGLFGLVWLREDLEISARFGPLTERFEVGTPITAVLPMLIGYEGDIGRLRDIDEEIFSLPAVKLITPNQESPRLNLTIFPDNNGLGFILLIGRVGNATDSEVELTRQMRARLMAEEEVARKSRELASINAELKLANRDLEDYAAVISHDLASPLRAMRYISDDIEQAVQSGTTEECVKSLQELRAQSQRMSSMLSALLDYASVGRKSDVAEDVDTRALLERIVNSTDKPKDIAIAIEGRWPTIHTTAAPLDLVIRNLIDNAIKHHDRPAGKVTISASELMPSDNAFHFSVADDGPGVLRKHQKAMFLPFRTLKDDTETEGHGMGLAFVRRTVETLGGQINIISDADVRRGTTFKVQWPTSATERPELKSPTSSKLTP